MRSPSTWPTVLAGLPHASSGGTAASAAGTTVRGARSLPAPQQWRYTGLLGASRAVDGVIAERVQPDDAPRPRVCAEGSVPYFLPDPVGGTARGERPSPNGRPYFFFMAGWSASEAAGCHRSSGAPGADLLIAGDGTTTTCGSGGRHGQRALPRRVSRRPAALLSARHRDHRHRCATRRLESSLSRRSANAGHRPTAALRKSWSDRGRRAVSHRGTHVRHASPAGRSIHAPGCRVGVCVSRYWSQSAVIPRYLDIVHRAAVRRGHQGVIAALAAVEVA